MLILYTFENIKHVIAHFVEVQLNKPGFKTWQLLRRLPKFDT